VRDQPVAEDRDRALAVVGEVGEAAPVRALAIGGVDHDVLARELLARAAAEVVPRERGDEQRAAGELGHLHHGDGAAARGFGPELGHVHDLPGVREPRDDREVDPLDVSHHCHARVHRSHAWA
jgi:hypothetical protein